MASEALLHQLAALGAVVTPATVQKLTDSSGTSQRTTVLLPKHSPVRIVADAAVYFKFGDVTVVATSADAYLPANSAETFFTGPYGYVAILRVAGTANVWVALLDRDGPPPPIA